ncbi:hypothetical protein GCM10025773_31140 [Microbacterium jejuense]
MKVSCSVPLSPEPPAQPDSISPPTASIAAAAMTGFRDFVITIPLVVLCDQPAGSRGDRSPLTVDVPLIYNVGITGWTTVCDAIGGAVKPFG